MNRNLMVFIIILLLTLVGGFLRFYKNTSNPPSLTIDEVSFGYNAYSILKTGRDEYGVFMPLTFKSVGDYKNPLLIYTLVPFIALFGLNEFGVRFSTALLGTISIPIFYFMLKVFFDRKKLALIGATIFTFSPWHIYYSRYATEQILAVLLLILGVWFLKKMKEGKIIWAILSALTLVLSMYTYHTSRLFIPIFIFVIFILNFKDFFNVKNKTLVFLLTFLVLSLPLIYISIFNSANARAAMVFLSQDIEYTRYIIMDHIQRKGEVFILISFWVKRYLNYFQSDFLFFNGLNMTSGGSLGLGVMYLFELPWLVLGIWRIAAKKIKSKEIFIIWILIGLIPASITNNEQSANRTLLVLPAILTVTALGAEKFIEIIGNMKNTFLRIGLGSIYISFIFILLVHAFLIFSIHFPLQKGEAFMEGSKETVLYAVNHKNEYQEIVYDPYRGIEAPYIVNIPYMYILFYSKYDPYLYQNEPKKFGTDFYHFDKFTIRPINWREDRFKKGTLFIGSPWHIPLLDLKADEILQKAYLSNGDLGLLVVSPHGF